MVECVIMYLCECMYVCGVGVCEIMYMCECMYVCMMYVWCGCE